MPALLLIILGIVGLAIDHQFNGQETISWALIGIGTVLFLISLTISAAAISVVNKAHRSTRSRRGF